MIEQFLEIMATAGPYLGTVLAMCIVQVVVILHVKDKTARVTLIYVTVGVQVLASVAGLFVSVLHDIT